MTDSVEGFKRRFFSSAHAPIRAPFKHPHLVLFVHPFAFPLSTVIRIRAVYAVLKGDACIRAVPEVVRTSSPQDRACGVLYRVYVLTRRRGANEAPTYTHSEGVNLSTLGCLLGAASCSPLATAPTCRVTLR